MRKERILWVVGFYIIICERLCAENPSRIDYTWVFTFGSNGLVWNQMKKKTSKLEQSPKELH